MTDSFHPGERLPIPGLVFRPWRDSDDTPGMAAARRASATYDQVDPLSSVQIMPTVDELSRMIVRSETFDPTADLLLVTVNGHIVGYELTEWWTENDGTRLYLSLGWLVPEWRGRGIGTAMLHWGEARCLALAAALPDVGKAFFGANASETEHDATALLLNEGYQVAFTVIELGIDNLRVPDLALPSGLVTRPLERGDLHALFDAKNDCFRNSPFAIADTDAQAWIDKQTDLALWQVAWDATTGEIAGLVQAGPYKGRGEIFEVGVRPPYRRKGLAQALLVRALHALADRGLTSARLWTTAENLYGSPLLYEKVGFRVLKRYPRYRKPLVYAS